MAHSSQLEAIVWGDHFKVVKILGTMLTFQTRPDKGLSDRPSSIVIGTIAHYLVGVGFLFVYWWLWSNDILGYTFHEVTLLGLINGIVGAIGWRVFIAIHPDLPSLPLKIYLFAIILSHVFFAYGVVSIQRQINL